jgi:hypothetical protein
MRHTNITITPKYTKKRVKASTEKRFPDENDYGKLQAAVLLYMQAAHTRALVLAPNSGSLLWLVFHLCMCSAQLKRPI